MCYMCKQANHNKEVCVTCRSVDMPCSHEKITMSYRWRPPKKNNHKAWKRIAAGDIWWDKRAVDGKETKSRLGHAAYVIYWTREKVAERKEKIRLRRQQYLEEIRDAM